MRAIPHKHEERKGVSQNKFEDARNGEETAAKEDGGGGSGNGVAAGAAPAHERDREGREADNQADEREGRRVREFVAQVAFYRGAGLEVDLFEELGGDGGGACEDLMHLLVES